MKKFSMKKVSQNFGLLLPFSKNCPKKTIARKSAESDHPVSDPIVLMKKARQK
jgi:hypothetical protein